MAVRAHWRKAVREFLYGMFVHEHVQEAAELRAERESLFLILTFGDMLGVPVMPPYYALRVLPHVAGIVHGWKGRMLRERQLGDAHEHHLHGV